MKKVPIEDSKDSLKLKNKNYMFYPLLIIILSIGIIVCFYIILYIKNLKKIDFLENELIKKRNKIKSDEIIIKENTNEEKVKKKLKPRKRKI